MKSEHFTRKVCIHVFKFGFNGNNFRKIEFYAPFIEDFLRHVVELSNYPLVKYDKGKQKFQANPFS